MSRFFVKSFLLICYTSCIYGDLLIFGGKKVRKSDNYQFTVSITFTGHAVCGGSLVTLAAVLTAAHCFDEYIEGTSAVSHYAVIGGTANLNKGGTKKNISDIIIHPKYAKSSPFSHDVAIVKLSESFEVNENVNTIEIAPANFPWKAGDTATIYGWGRTERNNYPNHLHFTNITLMRKDYCTQMLYVWRKFIEDEMQCGGVKEGGRDACDGDSGGPLVHFETSYLIGLVSWGKGCGAARSPGVYSQVSAFNSWIHEQISM